MKQASNIQVYINQIRNIPLLTKEQEIELATRYQAGDKSAKDKLVTANLRLVVMAAKHYTSRSIMSFDDLVQEGNLGLIRAVDTYDISKGYRFSTYAMFWIKQAISRALLNNARTVRVPVHMLELKKKYNKAQNELYNSLQREPTSEEIASKLSVKVDKIKELETLIKEPVSLNSALNDEDDGTLEDLVADPNQDQPDNRIDNEFRAKAIDKILDTLDKREKDILTARYGLKSATPKTLEQVGEELHLSKERVRQIEHNALHKLRNPLRMGSLKAHLN